MGPYGPGNGPGIERMVEHHGAFWGWFGTLLPILLFLVAVGVVIWAVLRFTSHRPAVAVSSGAVPVRPDDAVQELRVRYARGEVDRDEFLTRARDLGADLGTTTAAPAPPEERDD
jgi:putative membrane protein